MSDEGEDSSPRPKRKIIKALVLPSASSSDSDDSGPMTTTRKKRLRVLSEDGSDSSGSSVVCGSRRRLILPQLRDSDVDSDTSGWATDHSDAPKTRTKSSPNTCKQTSGFSSDSSEGNSDKCSICLMRFTDQQVGTPQNCEHIFCLDCITEWSKNVNTCPVDRMTFDSIVVRACAGGRVLRTEPVKVVERRSSVDMLVVEDPTVCEICGSSSNEETMLLCDGCDLGYHMECLTPPLTEIPADQWLCPTCDNMLDVIHLSEVNDLFSELGDVDLDSLGPRPSILRQPRSVRRSSRLSAGTDEPSTSTGRRGGDSTAASSSRSSRSTRRRPAPPAHRTHRRKYKRRRTKTVIIEYEVQENGKFPITKTIKRRVKKRRIRKRQPRTAARRTHVRASVRARLASLGGAGAAEAGERGEARGLALSRRRAGIPALHVFGARHDLDYFSEDEDGAASEAATTAVARPTAAYLSAHRQARRKMALVPSPPPASSAADVLSGILESQTLLHSKRAVTSISVDGTVNIKLRVAEKNPSSAPARVDDDKIDLTKGEDATKKAPSYPGQARGGGGWGGGYRGTYHREQTGNSYSRGPDGGYGGGYSSRGQSAPYHANNSRREENDGYHGYGRRPFPPADEGYFERNRRPPDARGPPGSIGGQRPDQGRLSFGGPWQPLPPRQDSYPPQHRHSFGGFENPLDMRMGQAPPAPGGPGSPDTPSEHKPQPYRPPRVQRPFRPDKPREERDEDERSDPDLVIDTDKYDPTEPTNDEDSGEEAAAEPPAAGAPLPAPPSPPALLGMLDSAVRQVLAEHRGLLAPPPAPAPPRSDDDDDGDCPNFSIYSAASVHIANNSAAAAEAPCPPAPDPLEDLVQEDDNAPAAPPDPAPAPAPAPADRTPLEKKSEEYNERLSKRCPITTNTRNPIKIKLNAPSLIKRQVSLYDEEDIAEEIDKIQEKAALPEPARLDDDRLAPEDKSDGSPADSELLPAELQHEEPASPGRASASPSAAGDTPPPADEEPETPAPPDDPVPELAHDKMTESISETEDERSYTPCLDENKSKDTSLDTDKDKGIEGLDTEMISEDEANGIFSEDERRSASPSVASALARAPTPPPTPPAAAAAPPEDGEISDRRKEEPKKKKKKDSKREGRDRKTKTKRSEVAFKKIGKSGKERNYRERDKKRERRDSSDAGERQRRKREKRKDLERYDVRTLVTEKRRRPKDAFGRDVSPRGSPSPSPPPRRSGSPASRRSSPRRSSPRRPRPSPSPPRARARPLSTSPRRRVSPSPRRRPSTSPRRRMSPSPPRRRLTISPRRRPSASPPRRRPTISPRRRPSISPRRRPTASPRRRPTVSPRRRVSTSPRRRVSPSPQRRLSPTPPKVRRSPSPRKRRRRSTSRGKRVEARRRRSASRARKRLRSGSEGSPKPKTKKKKRTGSQARSARRRGAGRGAWSGESRGASPRTPPAAPAPPAVAPRPPRRRDRSKHRRLRDSVGPSKEVFTSGDNILVSVSFKEQERADSEARRERRRERRRRRRAAAAADADPAAKPVAIIDLERSPFRELTPSPKNVIVLSDDEPQPAPAPAEPAGPKTPPEPAAPPAPAPAPQPAPQADEPRGPNTPPEPPDSPDAYDPYEPTRSASASPSPSPRAPPSPARPTITLEAAQKTNMSADEVLDRRPLSPIEKVLALLQSTRDVSPEPPPEAGAGAGASPAAAPPAPAPAPPAPRIVLPEPQRPQPPKLFLAKPSPIKSDPIKPMQQVTKLPRAAEGGDSPYSPGSSDFGDLFEPPLLFDKQPRKGKRPSAKVTGKVKPKKGKTQVDVKLDEDNLKIMDDLPSSAVEMQVKSKFLKKLNRQERVVEEVKLVLKPHYNKKHVTKDEYKHILRRAVPKICHNKSGEINPTKIQSLVEAYVNKFRKKHKLAAT